MSLPKSKRGKKMIEDMKYRPPYRHAYLAPMLRAMNYETHPRSKKPITRRSGGKPIPRNEPMDDWRTGTAKGNLDIYDAPRRFNWSAADYGTEGRRGTKAGTKMARDYDSADARAIRAAKRRKRIDREELEDSIDKPLPPGLLEQLRKNLLENPRRLDNQERNKLKEHSSHHSSKHMDFMKQRMMAGDTFAQAHKQAQAKVGK
tara:strand:- start:74 stop:682 length:609 start_codon:yes stop_codon:yes gene_type:complete